MPSPQWLTDLGMPAGLEPRGEMPRWYQRLVQQGTGHPITQVPFTQAAPLRRFIPVPYTMQPQDTAQGQVMGGGAPGYTPPALTPAPDMSPGLGERGSMSPLTEQMGMTTSADVNQLLYTGGASPQAPNTGNPLAGIAALLSAPLIPSDNPLLQAASVLSGFSAGMRGQDNPVIKQLLAERELQTNRAIQLGTLGHTVREDERRAEKDARDFKYRAQHDRDTMMSGMYSHLLKSDNESTRVLALKGFKSLGVLGPEEDIAALAKDQTFGFGTTTEGRLAAILFENGMTGKGPQVSRADALTQATDQLRQKSTVDTLASEYQSKGLTKAESIVQAERDISIAKLNPTPSLEERILSLRQQGKVKEADDLMAVAERLAQARATRVELPKNLDASLVRDSSDAKYRSRELAQVLEMFDPSFVGTLGAVKGIITKFSDIPGIPAFKDRARFASRLLSLTQTIKKELLGAARTPTELKDLARSLPDPDSLGSVADFSMALEAFVNGYISHLHALSEAMKEGGFKPISFNEEIAQLERGVKRLESVTPERTITQQVYQGLIQQGYTDADIRAKYRVRAPVTSAPARRP